MEDIINIPDRNAFHLRVTGEFGSSPASFSKIDDLIVNFVRRGRIAQVHGIDTDGHLVIENEGILARGLYGISLVGSVNGEPWRFHQPDVFRIIDRNAKASETASGEVVLTYDLTLSI